MANLDTLEKVRKYLSNKKVFSNEERELLEQVKNDLESFPISVLSRDDLVKDYYDAHLVDDGDMMTLAQKMGEDYWEQLSSVQIPIIGDYCNIPYAKCPHCTGLGGFNEDDHNWYCNEDCGTTWSYMKYILIEEEKDAHHFRYLDIGYPTTVNNKSIVYIPVTEYRKYYGSEPTKEKFFHILYLDNEEKINDLKDEGYRIEKIVCEKGEKDFGYNAYWLSCFATTNDIPDSLFVLVQFPEDNSYFEENNIGYPCCDSEDNGSRYVAIDDYIKVLTKEPDPENLYIIVQWPESQELMEKPDFESYSEAVMDEKGLNDFICPAYWVQQSSLK